MNPENVNPSNFQLERVIYNQDEFAIAIGIWQDDETRRFAMRWNIANTNAGYPNYAGNPMWFQLPINASEVVTTLIENWNKGEAVI